MSSLDGTPPLLGLDQVAAVIGCSRRTVARLIATGQLPVVKLSPTKTGLVRIPRASLIRFLRERLA